MLIRFDRRSASWLAKTALVVLMSGCALSGTDAERGAKPTPYLHVNAAPVATQVAEADAPKIAQMSFAQPSRDGFPHAPAQNATPKIDAAATNEAAAEQTIDLSAALRRAGAANPTIALAQEAVTASQAEWLQAKALLLPTLNAGGNYRLHNGALQNVAGFIRDVNSESLYYGAGAEARGSGTVLVPGVRLVSHLGDAILEPQVARHQLLARLRDADAVQQQILLEVAVAYLETAGTQAALAALARSRQEFDEVARVTTNFAKAGQGRDGDAQRALSEVHLIDVERDKASELQAVASANLARLLHLDPSVRLVPAEETPPVIEWVDPGIPLESLVLQAVAGRPEVAAQSARIAAGETRLRQERVRPWLPTIAVGFSAGEFGGGGGIARRFDRIDGRTDFDAMAYWTLQNLGFGNHALQNRARGQLQRAEAEQRAIIDEVRRQVSDAFATAQARRRDVEIARKRIANARQAYEQDLARTRNADGRPLEVLSSLNQLKAARLDFIRALVGSSQAQFQLAVALGSPATAFAARKAE
jgi:outer membrane protein TolC